MIRNSYMIRNHVIPVELQRIGQRKTILVLFIPEELGRVKFFAPNSKQCESVVTPEVDVLF